jgi:hypothetical protein
MGRAKCSSTPWQRQVCRLGLLVQSIFFAVLVQPAGAEPFHLLANYERPGSLILGPDPGLANGGLPKWFSEGALYYHYFADKRSPLRLWHYHFSSLKLGNYSETHGDLLTTMNQGRNPTVFGEAVKNSHIPILRRLSDGRTSAPIDEVILIGSSGSDPTSAESASDRQTAVLTLAQLSFLLPPLVSERGPISISDAWTEGQREHFNGLRVRVSRIISSRLHPDPGHQFRDGGDPVALKVAMARFVAMLFFANEEGFQSTDTEHGKQMVDMLFSSLAILTYEVDRLRMSEEQRIQIQGELAGLIGESSRGYLNGVANFEPGRGANALVNQISMDWLTRVTLVNRYKQTAPKAPKVFRQRQGAAPPRSEPSQTRLGQSLAASAVRALTAGAGGAAGFGAWWYVGLGVAERLTPDIDGQLSIIKTGLVAAPIATGAVFAASSKLARVPLPTFPRIPKISTTLTLPTLPALGSFSPLDRAAHGIARVCDLLLMRTDLDQLVKN